MMPSEPGVTGTPAAVMVARAATLSPMSSMLSGDGPMNLIPCSRQRRLNSARLGEEAVAGMDRLGAALQRRLDERRHDQVALRRRRRADADGLVGVR